MIRVEWSPSASHIRVRTNPHAIDNVVLPLVQRVRTYEEEKSGGAIHGIPGETTEDLISEDHMLDFKFGHLLIGYTWMIVDHIRLALSLRPIVKLPVTRCIYIDICTCVILIFSFVLFCFLVSV